MIITKGRHVLGKLSRNSDKRAPRNCEAALTWELRDNAGKLEFSACGEVWNHLKTDIVQGGQCVDELAALFPRDKLAQRIRETWSRYHLNGMNAGTPEQSAALEAGRDALARTLRGRDRGDKAATPDPLFYSDGRANWYAIARHLDKGSAYDIDCEILRNAGLLDVPVTDELRASALGGLPDGAAVYRYGSRWLYRAIPADVVALIKRGFQDETGEPLQADPEEAGEPERDLIAEAGLTVAAVFVPWSQSRNAKEKEPSLNWRVTLQCKGRNVLTCDYSAGSAHAPAYKKGWDGAHEKRAAIREECEKGKTVKRAFSIGAFTYGAAILPESLDVIRSLLLDASALDHGSFADWCAELGYSADSMQARAVYDECIAHAVAFRAAVGPEMFAKLQEGNA